VIRYKIGASDRPPHLKPFVIVHDNWFWLRNIDFKLKTPYVRRCLRLYAFCSFYVFVTFAVFTYLQSGCLFRKIIMYRVCSFCLFISSNAGFPLVDHFAVTNSWMSVKFQLKFLGRFKWMVLLYETRQLCIVGVKRLWRANLYMGRVFMHPLFKPLEISNFGNECFFCHRVIYFRNRIIFRRKYFILLLTDWKFEKY